MLDLQSALLLAAAGLAAGFVDAIAGGGGLLTVPALLAAGLTPQMALGTNKLQSVCGTALAAVSYGRAGLFSWGKLAGGIIITALAAAAGAVAVLHLQPDFLRRFIPVLLIGIAAYFWWKPELGGAARAPRMARPWFTWLFGVGLGFYDGFFGPGAGSFWMVAGVLLAGLDLRSAVGHTKVMNLASNAGSLVIFLACGQVHFEIAAVMIGGQLIGARLGSGLVIRRGAEFVRPAFLLVVLLLAACLLWQQWVATGTQ